MSLNLNENARGGNMCFTKVGLAEGTNANTLKIAAAAAYTIDGVHYAKAITDNIAMTACDLQAVSTTCLYLCSLDSSGTLTVTKGREVLTAELTADVESLEWPECPADECPIGAFKIATSSSVTFTSGTTDLSATGVTDTYYDLATVPTNNLT